MNDKVYVSEELCDKLTNPKILTNVIKSFSTLESILEMLSEDDNVKSRDAIEHLFKAFDSQKQIIMEYFAFVDLMRLVTFGNVEIGIGETNIIGRNVRVEVGFEKGPKEEAQNVSDKIRRDRENDCVEEEE